MAIDGIGMKSSFIGNSLLNVRDQLEDLQRQLGTGKKSETYSGLGDGRSFSISLRSQLNNLASYKDTIANVNTRLNVGNSVLQRLTDIGANIKTSASGSSTQLENSGQTMSQVRARDSLAEMLQLLNIQSGDRYLFSGRATDTKAVADIGDIMDGSGAKAGLKQIVDERRQADVGSGLGRLTITAPTATSVQLAEESSPLPFGMKLNAITSSLTGATVAGPTGTPPAISVDFTAQPNPGDKVKFTFNMPDGTQETIELTASTNSPPKAGEFTIGATATATAANFQAVLTTEVGDLANGALVAASAFAASDNFFNSSPPLRVNGTPSFAAATTLVNGTPADTVDWYTGESGTDPARGTAVARIDQSITVQYGARADEQALRYQVQIIAAYAAVTTSSSNPHARDQVQALNDRTSANLAPQFGQQSIQDIQSEMAGAQGAMDAASDRQTLTTTMTQTMLDGVEGVNNEEVIAKILALQTNLQASYQVTSMLYQTTLVKYI